MGRILFVGFIRFISSMIIYDIDIESIAILEAKTDTPPIVDANAPLTCTVTAQGFQPVAWWDTEVFECIRVVQHLQFTLCNRSKSFELVWTFALEQCLSVLALECLDHRARIYRGTLNLKRLIAGRFSLAESFDKPRSQFACGGSFALSNVEISRAGFASGWGEG